MNRISPPNRLTVRHLLRRMDRIAGDLNVLLVVIAIGLAALDVTFFVTQQVINNLPPITRVSHGTAPSQPN
jgi:hypothetical protein